MSRRGGQGSGGWGQLVLGSLGPSRGICWGVISSGYVSDNLSMASEYWCWALERRVLGRGVAGGGRERGCGRVQSWWAEACPRLSMGKERSRLSRQRHIGREGACLQVGHLSVRGVA